MAKRSPEEWLVAYYLSRFGERDTVTGVVRPPRSLGVVKWADAYDKFRFSLGRGREPKSFRNSLKNARDTFDSHLASGRVGWRLKDSERTPGPLGRTAQDVLDDWSGISEAGLFKRVSRYLASPADEIDDVIEAVERLDEIAGRGKGRQGYATAVPVRRAVEGRAMELARATYAAEWDIEDVSAWAPFDLRCVRPGYPERHVEVKGTTGKGQTILLTRNEVEHARGAIETDLVIVTGIKLQRSDEGVVKATGGTVRVIASWHPEASAMNALAFEYSVPAQE